MDFIGSSATTQVKIAQEFCEWNLKKMKVANIV